MIRTTSILSSALFVLAATACGAQGESSKLNIGETATLGQQLSDYAATWEGYAEAYKFGDDEQYGDNLYLTLDEEGVGTLRVGNAAIVGPATDPDVAYPPTGVFITGGPTGLASGMNYTVNKAAVAARRLQFEISLGTALDSWCPLQTSYEDTTNGGYKCLPNVASGTRNGECYLDINGSEEPVSCFVKSICINSSACACDADGCEAAPGATVTVDAALEDNGETLTGTLLYEGDRITIRMTRAD